MEQEHCSTIVATVCEVRRCELLVCDHCSGQRVLVHTDHACRFCCGECVCIHFNGTMTMSEPPQIFACSISRMSGQC